MKHIDYYYYETFDLQCVIGIRGVGNEIRLPKWDIVNACYKFMVKNGRPWTDYEALEWAYKWAQKESEYVDFEELPKEVLRIPESRETKQNV